MNNKGYSCKTKSEINNILYNNKLYKGYNKIKSLVKRCLTRYQFHTNTYVNKDNYYSITTVLQCSYGKNCGIKDHTLNPQDIKNIIKRQKQRLIKEIF